ncbi:hypothetical protein NEOLEDRAFT_1149948 [Neolentinus lepideus HHB14362 ss-1]|uniref:Uncharacterized protein n=1 Tax=Neolentinus lepideus HHB14362 ss-1 TaxID=1314782 RepID=A0A165QL58_9AGAM|nr:hypothetical protein NEOLEDRAFT_1149948 [Neolentinus lepideus HHB14362 ss-1]
MATPLYPAFGTINPKPASNRSNKHRLYIAYYSQGRAQGDDVKFHTALILAPKNPDPRKVQTWRYHAKNIDRDGDDMWIYEGKPTMNSDQRIEAMTFLCKVGDEDVSGLGLSMLFREIDVIQDERRWSSRHWVIAALQLLIDRKVIPQLHMSAKSIWQSGYQFTKSVQSSNYPFSVPTCDITGKEIKSEITWS